MPKPLFAPSILAQLPDVFLDQLAQATGDAKDAKPDSSGQRAIYRLWQDLQSASDEAIVRFGEASAQAVDGLITQATHTLNNPALSQVATALTQLVEALEARAPGVKSGHMESFWAFIKDFTDHPQEGFAQLSQRIDAQLHNLAQLETHVLRSAQHVLGLMASNEGHMVTLTQHTLACAVACNMVKSTSTAIATTTHWPATKVARLERRLQVLRTLELSATLTRQQLSVAHEHLLGVAERTQTLRYATLPLWRQQFLSVKAHQADGGHAAQQTHQLLLEQTRQLADLIAKT